MAYQSYGHHKSVPVADNFYCYIWEGVGNNCNSCLFVNLLCGERPHVIIDPGHITNESQEPCFNSLVKAMGVDGFDVGDIGLVINTHTHPDHCEANELIVERSQALIALSREEDEFRKTVGERLYSMLGARVPQFTPFFYIKEGDLNLGTRNGVGLRVIYTPGHSPGSVCFYWEDAKILITGDVIFYGSIGRTDFPSGSLSVLKESIDKLSALDVEHVIPGHSTEFGSIISGKPSVERNFQSIKLFF